VTTSGRKLSISVALAGIILAASPSAASTQVVTFSATTIADSGSMRVVSDAPMQTLLVTGAITPTGVTFTADTSGGSAAVGVAGFAGGNTTLMVNGSGLLTGTTMNGEALSVSVGGSIGDVPADSNTGANSGISVVIAQYN